MHAKLHIITGAPGSGKTAILRGLRQDLRVVDEPAREVLAEQRSIDSEGTPESNPSLFVDLLLQRSIDNHEKAQEWGGSVLFDRGVPDCVAYARLLGSDPEPSIRATAAYRYNREVLVTWSWAEIYTTDDERKMTFDATVEFHRLLEAAYEQAGYTLLEVPRGSVEDRVAFVERFIS